MKKLLGLTLMSLSLSAYAESDRLQAVIVTLDKATLSSQMTGEISKIAVREGDFVKSGTLLIAFDCRNAKAMLDKAKAKLDLAATNFDAQTRLNKLDSASHVELAEAKSNYETAKADKSIAEVTVDHCTVTAPFDAQVIDILVRQHETIKQHQDIIKLLDNSNLYVEIIMPSKEMKWLKKGQEFKLEIGETGKVYPVVVERIVDDIDAVSRSHKVIARFQSKNPELKAGMSGEVILEHE